jgi:hypothetical protein
MMTGWIKVHNHTDGLNGRLEAVSVDHIVSVADVMLDGNQAALIKLDNRDLILATESISDVMQAIRLARPVRT